MIKNKKKREALKTGQARVEHFWDDSVEHFRAIVQGSDDAIVSKTLEGIVTSWNAGARSIFGYAEHEMIGKPIMAIIPPERMEEEDCFMKKIMCGEKVNHYETERLRKDGSRVNVSVTLSPVRDAEGSVVGVAKIARDITLQLMLREASQRAAAILKSSDDAIVSKTLEGVVTSWNDGAARMFGYSREEMVGSTLEALFPPGRENEEKFILERISLGEKIDHFETERRRKDGSIVSVSVRISPMVDGFGKVVGVSKIARDLAQEKRSESVLSELNSKLEARVANSAKELAMANAALESANCELKRAQNEWMKSEKLAALSVLIAGVSHEMNTPLGNILTVGSSLLDEVADFESKFVEGKITKRGLEEYNRHLHAGLDLLLNSLGKAVEQIGHFKRVTVDQASERRRVFDLKAVVEDNVSVLRPQFSHTPHGIGFDIPDGIAMDSYPGALGQVITNLALNSLAHGFDGGMKGTVKLSAEMAEGGAIVVLKCSDNGKGIPRENLAKIFEPFFTTSMAKGGSGLGLSIVSKLVGSTLGGSIEVKSQEGAGAEFAVSLPLNAS